jgi:hypothetical protein
VRVDRAGVDADGALADPDLGDSAGADQALDGGLGDVQPLRGFASQQKRRTSGYTLTPIRVSPATLTPGRSWFLTVAPDSLKLDLS